MIEATTSPLAGAWQPTHLKGMYYGPNSVEKYLLSTLPAETSRACIITGNSLATKTPLIKNVEKLLGSKHAGTFANIKQHSPIAQLDDIVAELLKDTSIDTVISIGGGSPMDSSKGISFRYHEKSGKWLYHVTIPTTLSAAECTMGAGLTTDTGLKTAIASEHIAVNAIIYDAIFAKETPKDLFMSTGFRALDHAMELMIHPTATEVPQHQLALSAASSLFIYLPKYRANPTDTDVITQLQIASFASLGFLGLNVHGPLGLSHTLGYALGSPYSIPHGVTSTLTLGHVVKLRADEPEHAAQLARMLPFLGEGRSGDDRADARKVGDRILGLVEELGIKKTLKDYNVGEDQVPIIVERASKLTEGPMFDKIAELVKGLY
ncbi:Dehydroquinate synthase-like protein [Rhizodiscina lignyota]|uniref:Dehydroquinate synthase-like protein n=1 Tax=Rhizodiscina lignyota TaxID=1504668 RepID=A0A9P4I9I1_9PEZI|nr:Dehydroquinate synthase-like protein [Rhizodiscina lignyota]